MNIGDKYIVNEDFKTLCCIFPRVKGEILTIWKIVSKNRIIVDGSVGLHKIKISTLNRCCTKL